MFLGLLRSPRGLTLFVPTRHAAQPLMNLRFFSLTKIRQLADQTCPLSLVSFTKFVKDLEQWKLTSSGMAIFFDADFSMDNYRP
jgi:hypothetical protein